MNSHPPEAVSDRARAILAEECRGAGWPSSYERALADTEHPMRGGFAWMPLALRAIEAALRSQGVNAARELLRQWDEVGRTHRRRDMMDRFKELAASPYSDHDRINVTIRFGDVRAAVAIMCAALASPVDGEG